MPVYEFICQECRHPFEELVFGEEHVACPACKGVKLEKQFSAFGVNHDGAAAETFQGPGACGSCGDPRGPGACSMN